MYDHVVVSSITVFAMQAEQLDAWANITDNTELVWIKNCSTFFSDDIVDKTGVFTEADFYKKFMLKNGNYSVLLDFYFLTSAF